MVFLEAALEWKYNPLLALGRSGTLGLSGFVNKFNADAELLDDLVGHPRFQEMTQSDIIFNRMTIGRPNHTRHAICFHQYFRSSQLHNVMQKERNWFIQQLQHLAKAKCIRVTFLSGDVHCAAVGVLKTLSRGKKHQAPPPLEDHRYMLNVVTSKYRSARFMIFSNEFLRCHSQYASSKRRHNDGIHSRY
jgi:hypothetical protein